MKSRTLSLALLGGLLFTSCGKKMDHYLAVVCTDRDYLATMNKSWSYNDSEYNENWKVMRKDATVLGDSYTVIYVEYSHQDLVNPLYDYDRTLMYINEHVLRLEDGSWHPYEGSFGDKWSDIYGSYSNPGSYVYESTQPINGRDFPSNLRVETEDYLEYDFNKDNEKFRISNNMYHILLYYSFDYSGESGSSHTLLTATFELGTPSESIAHLDTITSEMIND